MHRLMTYPLFVLLVLLAALVFGDPPTFVARELGPYGDYGIAELSGGVLPSGGSCQNIDDAGGAPFSGWPLASYQGNWQVVSSWFCDPDYFVGYTHWGIDLAVPLGVRVVSTTEDAVVIEAKSDGAYNSGMGNHVKIRALDCHEVCDPTDPAQCTEVCEETPWVATYMHLASVAVSEGARLARGDVIGTVDSTGNSTGNHLHFQINGPAGAVDPAPTMPGYRPELRTIPRWNR